MSNELEETEDQKAWAAHQRELGYPKRLIVDRRNKHHEGMQKFFDWQYRNECNRLGLPAELSLFDETSEPFPPGDTTSLLV